MRALPGGIAATLLVACCTPALAASASATMTVSATASGACSVVASPLAFGTYSGGQIDGSARIATTCSGGTRYEIALDGGAGGDAASGRRLTGDGGGSLDYALYSDAGRTAAWGGRAGVDTVAGTGTGAASEATVYGRVPGHQQVADGRYSDLVTVTVSF